MVTCWRGPAGLADPRSRVRRVAGLAGPAAASTPRRRATRRLALPSTSSLRRSCGRPGARSRSAVARTLSGPRRRQRRSSLSGSSARAIARMALRSTRRSRSTARWPTMAPPRITGRRSATTAPPRITGLRFLTSHRPHPHLPRPAASSVPDYSSRAGAVSDFASRPGAGARTELPEYPAMPAMPARDELYGAPVAVPAAAEDLSAERSPARQRPEADSLRPVESGYSPGAARDQFQLEAGMREPVPAGAAQVRRLPTRGGAQPGHAASQPSLGQPSLGQPSLGQPAQSVQGAAIPAVPGGMDAGGGLSGSGGQPIAPVVPMEQAGLGYGGGRGGAYGGSRPANGPVSLGLSGLSRRSAVGSAGAVGPRGRGGAGQREWRPAGSGRVRTARAARAASRSRVPIRC